MTKGLALLNDEFVPPVAAEGGGNAKALLRLAKMARHQNCHDLALEIAWEARAAANGDLALVGQASDFVAHTVPSWHWQMLHDQPRNKAFEDALKRAVTPETRVLDVGSGSGLLAMFAAKAGAKHVISCEANPAIASVAREIVERNGFTEQVSILAMHSSDIDADTDLGGQVDLVVSEIIGKDVVDEYVLPSMRDVARRLLKPGGRMIPSSGDVRVALAWWDGLSGRNLNTICGFDMTPFNQLLPSRLSLQRDEEELALRGEAASLFSFDFTESRTPTDGAEIELVANGGPINGVVQWIGLQMDEVSYFENRPDPNEGSSWGVQFFPFSKSIDAKAGARIRIAGSHLGNALRVWKA